MPPQHAAAMTDIVERLREGLDANDGADVLRAEWLMDEAADEIVRLREELRAVLAHVVELRAEISALKC